MSHRVIATTIVASDPAAAFEAFTTEVDAWWKQGPKYRPSVHGAGVLRFEPHAGGRFLETYSDGSEFVFGRIQVWEPGRRLVFDSFARAFAPGESTQVEVRFEAEGENTRVTIEQRGWDKFPESHPVRHGMPAEAFHDVMSVWWADLLVAIKSHVTGASTRKRS
jgi:uncharacterized protein YndB with AHSA1/START domain